MTSYAQLQTDVLDYAAKPNLTTKTALLVRVAESAIRRDVRVMDMQKNTPLAVPATGSIALPDRFLGLRYASLVAASGSSTELTQMPSDVFNEMNDSTRKVDNAFALEGNTFRLAAAGAGVITSVNIGFWQAYEALSVVDTNWLLLNHYDVYLYAVLAELHAYVMDVDDEIKHRLKYKDVVQQLHVSELRKQRSVPSTRRPGGAIV